LLYVKEMDMRKFSLAFSLFAMLALALLAAALVPGASAASQTFPPIIPLPDNFNPEGVVTGRGPVIYAGSLADGAIYEANLRTGKGQTLVFGQPGDMAVGLSYDARSDYLFVSGGTGGTATVYEANSGHWVTTYQLADLATVSFINDAIVTRDAVYFTNSFANEFYRLPLGPAGDLPAPNEVETIALGGEFDFKPGPFVNFNGNGIVASQDGGTLLIVNSQAATLYRVDPTSGEAVAVDVMDETGSFTLTFGDGLVLLGRTLYVVQNQLDQIAEIQLTDDFLSGQVTDIITSTAFRVPATAAAFGSHL
jgi:hypothetical protein